MQGLVRAYQTTFGDADVWGETYSEEDVRTKLRAELGGEANLRLCVAHESESTVAGFLWAQLLGAADIARAIGTIKFSASLATPDLTLLLQRALQGRLVIYIHDFGILKAYRGRIWLTNLICPPLWEIAKQSGVTKVLFWSVPGTHVDAFARRVGFTPLLVANGMHFHLGEFALDRPCDGINLPWKNRRLPVATMPLRAAA